MSTYTITHSADTSDFNFNLLPPIHLNQNKKYEAALSSINLYNSIPNITEENNKFKYSTDNGTTWKIITLNKGTYEIQAINDEIQRAMITNGDYDAVNNEFYIIISADIPQLKSVVNITKESYLVNFDVEKSIGPTLGFQPVTLQFGYNKSQDIVKITKTNLVLVNVDLITGSYVNGRQSPAIYSFDPYKVPPGYKLNERPNPSLTYYPVNRLSINSLRIWLTDQNNKEIDLQGETVTIKIQIREVVNIKEEIKRAINELKKDNIL
jgi:hypothetical protein